MTYVNETSPTINYSSASDNYIKYDSASDEAFIYCAYNITGLGIASLDYLMGNFTGTWTSGGSLQVQNRFLYTSSSFTPTNVTYNTPPASDSASFSSMMSMVTANGTKFFGPFVGKGLIGNTTILIAQIGYDRSSGTGSFKVPDSYNNCRISINYTAASGSCAAYSGTGNYVVDCSQNCTMASATILKAGNLSFTGRGKVTVSRSITNFTTARISSNCSVEVTNSSRISKY